jgi:hypothetical protein
LAEENAFAGIGAVEQAIGAGLAFDGVAAIARIPDEGIVAAANVARSLPPPVTVSLPSLPASRSLPALPMMVSLPAPPSTVSLSCVASSADASMTSLPPRPLTKSVSLAPSA